MNAKTKARLAVTAFLAACLIPSAGMLVLRPYFAVSSDNPLVREMGVSYGGIVILFSAGCFIESNCSKILQARGNTLLPMAAQVLGALLNIVLDPVLIFGLFGCPEMGVAGAAVATVIAQAVSGIGIAAYTFLRRPELRITFGDLCPDRSALREIIRFSFLTCIQQSVMNFGILLVQGLVNTFGTTVMAAFAAAVKIDSFAYMPAQDFGNAFSTFVAQNYGAGQQERIRRGSRCAFLLSAAFCLLISAAVFVLAEPLMQLFVSAQEAEVIRIGAQYLRIEGAFYVGIGLLFLLYGYYRAVRKPGMSLILTLISLGLRVALAYILAPFIGETGIWLSVPIGWAVADMAGLLYLFFCSRRQTSEQLDRKAE